MPTITQDDNKTYTLSTISHNIEPESGSKSRVRALTRDPTRPGPKLLTRFHLWLGHHFQGQKVTGGVGILCRHSAQLVSYTVGWESIRLYARVRNVVKQTSNRSDTLWAWIYFTDTSITNWHYTSFAHHYVQPVHRSARSTKTNVTSQQKWSLIYKAEMEPGLNLWPDPTRSLSVCALNWEIILTTVCATGECFLPKVSWSMQHTIQITTISNIIILNLLSTEK